MADQKHHNGAGHNDGGPHINRAKMASQYGFALAFMNSDPELKQLFNQAVKNTWSTAQFVAHLRDTNWFKHHSANVRNAILQQTSDPATYKQGVEQLSARIRDIYGNLFGAAGLDHDQVQQWAENAYRLGWSDNQIIDHISHSVDYQKLLKEQSLGGTAAQTVSQVHQLAQAYGVNPGQKFIDRQVKRITDGQDTIEGVTSRLQDWAKAAYPMYTAALDSGQTIQDIAQPYISKMADLLEINPDQISVHAPKIQAALTKGQSKDGSPAAMSLTEFEDMVRQDPRWQYTNNAREQAMSVTANLLQSFGLVS